MKIIVGLGNFGDKYAYTYHNMGFLAVECLADRLGAKFKKKECDSLTAECFYKGEKVILAKPLTFMNLSGVAVKQLLNKYKADLSDLLVIFDDIDIEKGTLRKRANGSGGTHNGMKNIIEVIKTENFARLRIGIGRPPEFVDLASYVLGEVKKEERPLLAETIERSVDEAIGWIGGKG